MFAGIQLFSIVFLASIICLLANNDETPGKMNPREVKDRSECSLWAAAPMILLLPTMPILKINISVWMLGLQCAAMCRQSLVSIYITSIPSWPSKCQALQMATVICGMIGPGSWANGEPLPWRWLPAKKMEDAQRTHLFSWKPPLRDVESCCQFVIQMPLQCQCIYRDMAWLPSGKLT